MNRRAFRRLVGRCSWVASASCLGLAVVAGVAAETVAGAADAGVAAVVTPTTDDPSSSGLPLAAGDSSTDFSLRLPDGAACTGDSAGQDYRVHGYVVAASIDPSTLEFSGIDGPEPVQFGGPQESFRQPLHDADTSAYTAVQTANADEEGGPGFIINVPAFSFGVYEPGNVPPGRYNVGIACVGPGRAPELDRYWNVELTVTENTADAGPAGIAWQTQDRTDDAPFVASSGVPSSNDTTSGAATADASDPGAGEGTAADADASSGAAAASGETSDDRGAAGPMMTIPVVSLARAAGSMSVFVWVGLGLVLARMGRLLTRQPTVVGVGA